MKIQRTWGLGRSGSKCKEAKIEGPNSKASVKPTMDGGYTTKKQVFSGGFLGYFAAILTAAVYFCGGFENRSNMQRRGAFSGCFEQLLV